MQTMKVLAPIGSELWLHEVSQPALRPIVIVSSDESARARLNAAETHVGILDQEGKRAHLYEVRADSLERVLTPLHLPKDAHADDIAVVEDVLFAGGSGPDGEAAWMRSPGSPSWTPVPMPSDTLAPGKGIDALLVDGPRLIGVDNIVMPKWAVVWDISNPAAPTYTDRLMLVSNTTYEQIRAAAIGGRFVATLSSGSGRGGPSVHVALLDRTSLEEAFCYSWFGDWTHATMIEIGTEVDPNLESLATCVGIAMAGDVVYLACQESGLLAIDLRGVDVRRHPVGEFGLGSDAPAGPDPVRLRLALTRVDGVVAVGGGVVASGEGLDGTIQSFWAQR